MQKTNNKTIAKNTLALYFRMGITMLVGLYTSRVILQVLGVTDMGINAAVGGVVTFASFLNTALANGTSRFLTIALGKEDHVLMKSTFSTCFWVHLILALVIAFFMETIGLWFLYNQLVIPPDRMDAAIWVFHLGVISLIVTMTQVPYSSAIVANERMDMYAYTSLVDVVLKLVIVYMLLLFDVDKLKLYSTLFFATHLGMLLFYRWFCITRFEGCRIERHFDKRIFKPILFFSGWQLFGSLSVNLYNNGILVLLNMFFAPAVVAARAISIQVNNHASQFMVNFRTASNPQIIKRFAAGDFEGFKKLHLSTVKYSFYLMWLISLPIYLLSYPILELWLGEVPEYTDIFLKLVVIQGLFQVFDTGFWTAIYTKGRMKENALIAPFVCFLFFPIVYVLFKMGYSPVTLSWAYIICYALLGLVEKPMILVKIVGYNWKDFPPLFWDTFKVVVISVVVPVSAHYYISSITDNSLTIAASVCSICFISVSLTVWIFGIDVETRNILKSHMFNIIKKYLVNKYKSIKLKKELDEARKPYLKVLKDIRSYLKSRGVTFIFVELPVRDKITGLTEFEKERLDNWSFDFNKYKEELPKLKMLYGDDVTQKYILSVFDGGVVVQGEKRKILLDFESEHQHIINGRRVTIGQPAKYKNTIYTHGACTFRGTGVEDQQTIASYLQAEVNKAYPNSYRVVNSAIGRGSNIFDDFEYIKEQQYTEGDIVIVGGYGRMIQLLTEKDFKKMKISRITTSQLFCQPHAHGTWFNDLVLHTNHNGNKAIADHIFDCLENMHILTKTSSSDLSSRKPPMPKDVSLLTKGEKIYGDNPDLLKFIDSLKPYKRGDEKSINGSIVMNCNPFTLGHRYLIEYASSQVENLYIFVVEENRSYFTFDDRLDLVRKGTADLKNVIVLPSGNFIISATTFPGYFYKDNLKEAKIDCSNDLSVFAQYIAPALNIKIRFAGEEPLDPVTNQYNEGMKEILPQYGMEFRAIPRKEDDEGIGVISASRVRRHFEKGELEEIKKIVPKTTFDYLVARYHREHPNG